MKGTLIIIDGTDASGKATQAKLLFERLQAEGETIRKVEFTDYDSPSSALIKMYLKGDFGKKADDVSPYAASAFYAVDRFASWKMNWGAFYEAGGLILADRYVTSNMIHQAAKIDDAIEKDVYLDWLWDLEFHKLALPVPDCVLFLDMPPTFSAQLMAGRSLKSGESKDIHEQDQTYLTHCYEHSQTLAQKYGWKKVSCVEGDQVKSIDSIHEELYDLVKPYLKRQGLK